MSRQYTGSSTSSVNPLYKFEYPTGGYKIYSVIISWDTDGGAYNCQYQFAKTNDTGSDTPSFNGGFNGSSWAYSISKASDDRCKTLVLPSPYEVPSNKSFAMLSHTTASSTSEMCFLIHGCQYLPCVGLMWDGNYRSHGVPCFPRIARRVFSILFPRFCSLSSYNVCTIKGGTGGGCSLPLGAVVDLLKPDFRLFIILESA